MLWLVLFLVSSSGWVSVRMPWLRPVVCSMCWALGGSSVGVVVAVLGGLGLGEEVGQDKSAEMVITR